jgi:hypothetical protein
MSIYAVVQQTNSYEVNCISLWNNEHTLPKYNVGNTRSVGLGVCTVTKFGCLSSSRNVMLQCGMYSTKYMVITNDVSDYINLLVRIAHIICNHPSV